MKNSVLILFLSLTSFYLQAQNEISTITNVNFYGVDFSKAKTFGMKETPNEIKYSLCQINDLFLAEAKKYNIQKYMGKEVKAYPIEATQKNNEQLNADNLYSEAQVNELAEKDVQSVIKKLSYKENNSIGLIFIAETLDKANKKGTYHVVFFDEATKKIISSQVLSGKAAGFGMRNYWAASVLDVMKNWEKAVKQKKAA